jgi:hypothetical protein
MCCDLYFQCVKLAREDLEVLCLVSLFRSCLCSCLPAFSQGARIPPVRIFLVDLFEGRSKDFWRRYGKMLPEPLVCRAKQFKCFDLSSLGFAVARGTG